MESRVKIIGCGMNCKGNMTVDGENAVKTADILIGAGRILEGFESLDKEKFCSYDTRKIADRICDEPDKTIAVLMSGDCGFFSGAQKLSAELESNGVLL